MIFPLPVFSPLTLGPLTITLTAHDVEDTAGSSYSFNDQSAGGTINNTLFVLAVKWAVAGGATFATASIGGSSASIIGQANGTNTGVGIAYRVVPSGSDVDLAWTFTANPNLPTRSGFGLYRLDNVKSATPFDFDNPLGGDNATRSATLDVPANGGAIAVAGNGSNVVMAASGATEVYQDLFANNGRQIGATFHTSTVQSGHSIQITNSREVMAASWR